MFLILSKLIIIQFKVKTTTYDIISTGMFKTLLIFISISFRGNIQLQIRN